MPFFKCDYCTYFSDRKYNMQKHIGRKHLEKVLKNEDVKSVQNVTSNVQNVTPKVQNVTPNVQNVTPNIFQCSKCNKIYKTARHLHNHE